MRVFVTGGAGYIGSHVVDLLIQGGHEVTVLDSLEKGHREAVHPSATFVQGDAGDAELLDRLLAHACFDAVLHFAAYIEAGESMVDPGRFFVNNTARPLVLLDRMVAHRVKKIHLLQHGRHVRRSGVHAHRRGPSQGPHQHLRLKLELSNRQGSCGYALNRELFLKRGAT